MKSRKPRGCVYIRQSRPEQVEKSRALEQQLNRLANGDPGSGLVTDKRQEGGNGKP